MTGQATIADLFELAIELEDSAQKLYTELATKFAHHQEVADFWKQYAVEEAGHARWLERVRDKLNSEELSAPADPSMLKAAHGILKSSVEKQLAEIKDLRGAYQLASELENSETNAIFEFLVGNFAADEQTRNFLRSHLKDHIGKLMLWFPTQFNVAVQDD
jgi:rubrerythrin